VTTEMKVINEDRAIDNMHTGTFVAGLASSLFLLMGVASIIFSTAGAYPAGLLFWAAFYGFAAWRIGHANSLVWAWIVWLAYFAVFVSVQITFSYAYPAGGKPWWQYLIFFSLLGLCIGAWRGIEGCSDLRELKKQKKEVKPTW
jgi:hypothetical protein